MNRTLLNGDCLEKLKEIEDNSIDLICTDPPYGYGFMNKDWDKAVVGVETWRECLRVLKSGSFAFIMSAPRQDVLSHMIINLSEAGFKTDFTSIYWAYASGFPKAMNISKAVDKKLGCKPEIIGKGKCGKTAMLGGLYDKETNEGSYDFTKPSSPQAKKLDGSYAGFQPKPAVEVILVCMKPLSEKNYIDQAMNTQKGITWLDDCRIPYIDDKDFGFSHRENAFDHKRDGCDQTVDFMPSSKVNPESLKGDINKGRFPANLLVSDNALDIGKKTKSIQNKKSDNRLDDKSNVYCFGGERNSKNSFNDSGDFSRYFDLDKWEAQFIITPKPSKSEKNDGLNQFIGKQVNDGRTIPPDNAFQRGKTERQNTHPTVKPLSLFKYLITMGSREGDTVLDPFMGSGTTAVSCEMLARNWTGIELNPEYIQIIEARVDKYRKQMRIV